MRPLALPPCSIQDTADLPTARYRLVWLAADAATILPLSHIVDEFVPETLMVPLTVVVRDELGQRRRCGHDREN